MVDLITCKKKVAFANLKLTKHTLNLLNHIPEKLSCINRRMIKWVRPDDRLEYVCEIVQRWFGKKDIVHKVATAYSPESNSRVRKVNETHLSLS